MGHVYEYVENDRMEFTCSAELGFPAPTLSLSIGENFQINTNLSSSELLKFSVLL
jgi:hypothetical protein